MTESAFPSDRHPSREMAAENRRLRELVAQLTDRLAQLQRANEGAYEALNNATGGARFDVKQPFGSQSRPLGQLPKPWSLGRYL